MQMLFHAGFPPTEAQTLVEYSGLLGSISARLSAARDSIEAYVGKGNLKYLLIGFLALLLLMLIRRWR